MRPANTGWGWSGTDESDHTKKVRGSCPFDWTVASAEVLVRQGGAEASRAGCGKTPFGADNSLTAKPPLILLYLRQGWKPRPFKAQAFTTQGFAKYADDYVCPTLLPADNPVDVCQRTAGTATAV